MFGAIKSLIQNTIGFVKCVTSNIKYTKGTYIGVDVHIINNGGITLGNHVTIRPSTEVYAVGEICLGNNTEIGNHSTISSQNKIIIGSGVLTGPHVFIADHNHEYMNINKHIYLQGVRMKNEDTIIIGDGTWIGTNAVIVGNVKVGKNCVVGANSVVLDDIPDYCVVAGAPAKIIKMYNSKRGEWIHV